MDLDRNRKYLPVKLIACSDHYAAGILAYDKYWDENGHRSVYFSVEPEACSETVAGTLLENAVSWTSSWEYKNVTTLLGEIRVHKDLADAFQNAKDTISGESVSSESIMLIEEGQTIIKLDTKASEIINLLIAHPTSDNVSVILTRGNAEFEYLTKLTDGLTQVKIHSYEGGSIEISLSADPDSSFNPAYLETIVTPPTPTTSPTSTPPTPTTTPTTPEPSPSNDSPIPLSYIIGITTISLIGSAILIYYLKFLKGNPSKAVQ